MTTKRCSFIAIAVTVLMSFFFSGCSMHEQKEIGLDASFFTSAKMNGEGEILLEMGAEAEGEAGGEPAASASWELRDAAGALRASGYVTEIYFLDEGELIVSWESKLDPGQYELAWGSPEYGGVIRRFEVFSDGGGIRLGGYQQEVHTTEFPPTP